MDIMGKKDVSFQGITLSSRSVVSSKLLLNQDMMTTSGGAFDLLYESSCNYDYVYTERGSSQNFLS